MSGRCLDLIVTDFLDVIVSDVGNLTMTDKIVVVCIDWSVVGYFG